MNMNFVIIPGADRVMRAPPNFPSCQDLHVRSGEYEGRPCNTCEIMPTQDEIALMAAGQPLRLRVIGEGWPPVALWVPEPGEE